MPTPMKMDHVIESLASAEERELLARAAGRRLGRGEARSAWPAVLRHKWLLSERLGRDVGLRVAAVDYFDNVRIA
jgi:Domain of unknown function (DUF4032)